MTHEFEELALYRHNYSTWAMDIKISLAFRCMRQSFHLLTGSRSCLLYINTMLYILKDITYTLI
jgi:hypothetical protein